MSKVLLEALTGSLVSDLSAEMADDAIREDESGSTELLDPEKVM